MANYCYRHGEAWLSLRSTGGFASNYDLALPEIDSLNLSLSVERIEHRSKRSSIASLDLSVPYFLDGSGEMMISEHSADILKTALYGNKSAVAGGAFAATAFEKALVVVNDVVPLPGDRSGVTSLVITDSAGSPATLTLDTHYQIVDADAGLIKFINLASFTQPFKAAGTEAAGTGVGILTQRVFEMQLRFKGINVLNNDKKEIVTLYKLQLDPTSEYAFMGDGGEPSKVTLPFRLLKDDTKSPSATFGQYGWNKIVT